MTILIECVTGIFVMNSWCTSIPLLHLVFSIKWKMNLLFSYLHEGIEDWQNQGKKNVLEAKAKALASSHLCPIPLASQ